MNIGEIISIPHADYGCLRWTVIDKDEKQLTLWCEALPRKMAFSVPRDSQRYLRLDMAAKGKKGGAYPHGVLCDDVQTLSRAEITSFLVKVMRRYLKRRTALNCARRIWPNTAVINGRYRLCAST